MKKILVFLVIGIFIATASHGKKVHIVFNTKVSQEYKDTVRSVVDAFEAKYHALGSVLYVRDTVEPFRNDNGTIVGNGARGFHCTIVINLEALSRPGFTVGMFRDIIAHELFHTLQPASATKIKEFTLLDKKTVVNGVQGLNFCIKSVRSDVTFAKMEEASAEALGSLLYKNYAVSDKSYYNIGNFMLSMILAKWIQPADLLSATKTSNPKKIIALILNKPVKDVTDEEVGYILNLFSGVYQTGDIKTPFLNINKYRLQKK